MPTKDFLKPDDYVEAPDGIGCPDCFGSGTLDLGDGSAASPDRVGPQVVRCTRCYGTGRVPEPDTFEVEVTLTEFLRLVIMRSGVRFATVADALGLSVSYVSLLLSGEREHAERLGEIEKYLRAEYPAAFSPTP